MAVTCGVRPDRRPRAGRAVGVSTVASVAALVSHLAVGGRPPALLAVAAVIVLSWLPALALIGRGPTRTGLALVVVASQCAFHLVFTLTASGGVVRAVPPVMTGMAGMAGMHGTAAADPVRASSMPVSPAMWAAHAAAALLTLACCLRGDAAVRSLRAAARRLALALVPLIVHDPIAPPERRPAGRDPRRAPAAPLTAHPRRGPPLALSR